ncbi:histidine kinase [Streptomyces sp. NBC_01795]|nr:MULTISPECIES: histidine kinase [unclassified Streptomyces]WSA97345.1 histidine kinase [Streptomyces sp. NBC_01795]WSB81775.1 histidine kinase [Streptomyces sp. NBC_01775]WSS17462.1 histidine kinase [Streptomyces sp. NBC_01186]WSS46209.1 histidine kinase [Streptomyces sp. NBC_01187]
MPRVRLPPEAADGLRALGAALLTPSASREPLLAHANAWWVRKVPYVLAVGFALVLIPVTTQILANDYELNGALSGALGVLQTAPLLLAVTRPLSAWWIVFTADTVGALALLYTDHDALRPWPWPPAAIVGYLVLCLALALRESRRTLLGVWIVTVLASLVLGFLSPARSDGTNVLLIVLSGAMLLLGATLRERAEVQRRLAEQETISEAERAQRTLLEERARIARELHDVVAHHMSVITVQADSAPYRLDGLPEAAREEFGTIAATARESLAEMRRLLGVLRSEKTHGERAPQPGLERLEQLVEATVRAGVPAGLSVDVPDGARDTGEMPAAGPAQTVTLSAYRIVQEALANVVRHAPGAVTRVSVAADEENLTVVVVNGPSPDPDSAPLETAGTGHGLVGMRERVRLVGGSLDTGPLPDGGFRVAARLPLDGRPQGDADDEHPERGAGDEHPEQNADSEYPERGVGSEHPERGAYSERPDDRRNVPQEGGPWRDGPYEDGKDTPTA